MTYEELKKLGYDNLTRVGLKLRNRKFTKKDLPEFDFSSSRNTNEKK